MRLKLSALLTLVMLLVVSANLMAADDQFGAIDTVYAEPYKIDAKHWGINISMFNDEDIIALSVPVTFSAEKNRLVADSTIFTGGRAESFRVKFARVDTTTQCLTIGLIADIGVSVPPIAPGKGRIATIFVSSLDGKEIGNMKVDSTTTPPSNSLQLIKQPSDGIVPAFVVKKAGEKEAAGEATKEEKK